MKTKQRIALVLTAALCTAAIALPHAGSAGMPVSAASAGVTAVSGASTDGMQIENGVLVKYTGSEKNVVIPNTVKKIGDGAFSDCAEITSLTIPSSVTSIGDNAFYYCASLRELTVPDSVTSIGRAAFNSCISLQNVKLSAKLTSLSSYLFSDCYELKSVTVPSSVTSVGDHAFMDCCELGSVTLPSSVKSIGEGAFTDCRSLKSVAIPSAVTVIEEKTFSGCTHMTSVTIPKGATTVGTRAFEQCDSLTEVTLPSTVRTLGESAFAGCDALRKVTLPEGITSLERVFEYCPSLESVTVPDSVTNITAAFYDCKGLKSVKLPSKLTVIGENAFYNCGSLNNVTIPSSVKTLSNGAFFLCASLSSVSIPQGVTAIPSDCFRGAGIQSVSIPSSVTTVGDYAFTDCDKLGSVSLPSVKTVGKGSFAGCTSLKSASLPSTLTGLGNYAFAGCTSLQTPTLPSSLTTIGNYAFSGCSSMQSFKTPASVTQLREGVLFGCSSLTSVTLSDKITSVAPLAFADCKALKSITLPASVTSIGGSAFTGCTSLTSVSVPASVKKLNVGTFAGCSRLTTVSIPASVTSLDDSLFYRSYNLTDVNFGGTKAQWQKLVKAVTDNGGSIDLPKTAAVNCKDGSIVQPFKITVQPQSESDCIGEASTVSVGVSGAHVQYQWYGKLSGESSFSKLSGETGDSLHFKVTASHHLASYYCKITDGSGKTLQSDTATVTVRSQITVQPEPYWNYAPKGGKLTFTVKATGVGLSYQWQLSDDGGSKWYNSSVKKNTYTVTVGENNNGRLVRCIVTDANGAKLTSNAAQMLMTSLQITSQPTDAFAVKGGKATFTVKATGDGLSYQWQLSDNQGKKWYNSTVTKNTYTATLGDNNNGRLVRCIVTDSLGAKITSNAAAMRISSLKLTQQPTDAFAPKGGKATFAVKATGTGLSYQWQLSDNQGKKWYNSTVTKNTYTATLGDNNNGRYVRCIVTDANGAKVTSSSAVMRISTLKLTQQPTDAFAPKGGKATFTVRATGDGLSYQWQLSDNQGKTWYNSTVTKNTYTATLGDNNNGRYVRCIVTDANGAKVTTSSAAMRIR